MVLHAVVRITAVASSNWCGGRSIAGASMCFTIFQVLVAPTEPIRTEPWSWTNRAIYLARPTMEASGTATGNGCGNIFELFRSASGRWSETAVEAFTSHSRNGNQPYAGLIFDDRGALYATTSQYGIDDFGNGTVLKLTRSAAGDWSTTLLYSFGAGTDGAFPEAAVVRDKKGRLYGTTMMGGTGCGL